MIEPRFAGPQGVLELTEVGETVLDEVGEGGLGLFRGDGPIEVFKRARVASEAEIDEFEDELGGAVVLELERSLKLSGTGFGKTAAIFGVEVPAAADGIFSV